MTTENSYLVPIGSYVTRAAKGWRLANAEKDELKPEKLCLVVDFPVKYEKTNEDGTKLSVTKTISKKFWLHGGALEISARDLATMGVDMSKGLDVALALALDGKSGGIDGKEIEIVVEHRDYEGKTYNEVKYINSTGGLAQTMKPASSNAIAVLLAKLKGYQPPARGSHNNTPPPAAAAKPATVAPQDDEIPF